MIRFGAIVSVVAVAIGLLIAGGVSGDLILVYVSIGLAALALVLLIAAVVIWRDEAFVARPAGQADDQLTEATAADEVRETSAVGAGASSSSADTSAASSSTAGSESRPGCWCCGRDAGPVSDGCDARCRGASLRQRGGRPARPGGRAQRATCGADPADDQPGRAATAARPGRLEVRAVRACGVCCPRFRHCGRVFSRAAVGCDRDRSVRVRAVRVYSGCGRDRRFAGDPRTGPPRAR